MKQLFEEFFPEFDIPILVSFVNHLKLHGYSCEVDFGFWDVFGYKDSDQPEIAVLQVKNTVRKDQIYRLARENYPYKVILAETALIDVHHIDSIRVFLAQLGVGFYIRNVGWYVLPHTKRIPVVDDIQFVVAKRWYKDEHGNWVKNCTKCGKAKGPHSFYRRYDDKARDPYRNICISCFKKPKT